MTPEEISLDSAEMNRWSWSGFFPERSEEMVVTHSGVLGGTYVRKIGLMS